MNAAQVDQPVADFTPGPWDVDDATYYADRSHVSHSMLERFRQSPRLYYDLFVAGTGEPEDSPALAFGRAFHAYGTQNGEWARRFVVAPEVNRRFKAGKAEWAYFLSGLDGREPVTAQDYDLLRRMWDGLRRNPTARLLVDRAGSQERPLRWRCPETGLALKGKPDKVFPQGVLIDLKTCEDPAREAWGYAYRAYGYYRQAPYYLGAAWHALGMSAEFFFIAVGKRPPHDAVVYAPDAASVELGRRQNAADLRALKSCLVSGEWSSPQTTEVQTCSLPNWFLRESEQL